MAKSDPASLVNKVMNTPDLRQMLFGLATLYLLVFWVVPFLLWLIKRLTGWNF